MKPIALVVLILMAATAMAQDATKKPEPATEERVFNKVTRVGEDSLRSFFMFTVSGHDYTIRADGFGERSFDEARARNFNLKVDERRIQQVSFRSMRATCF